MALMLAKLYTALREAGADDDKAREAAEEVASFENRLANVEASLMVLKWMDGFNLILTVATVGMLFFVLANELAANAAATTDALFNPHRMQPKCLARAVGRPLVRSSSGTTPFRTWRSSRRSGKRVVFLSEIRGPHTN